MRRKGHRSSKNRPEGAANRNTGPVRDLGSCPMRHGVGSYVDRTHNGRLPLTYWCEADKPVQGAVPFARMLRVRPCGGLNTLSSPPHGLFSCRPPPASRQWLPCACRRMRGDPALIEAASAEAGKPKRTAKRWGACWQATAGNTLPRRNAPRTSRRRWKTRWLRLQWPHAVGPTLAKRPARRFVFPGVFSCASRKQPTPAGQAGA